jgi:hypothetical protein
VLFGILYSLLLLTSTPLLFIGIIKLLVKAEWRYLEWLFELGMYALNLGLSWGGSGLLDAMSIRLYQRSGTVVICS